MYNNNYFGAQSMIIIDKALTVTKAYNYFVSETVKMNSINIPLTGTISST